MQLWTLGVPVCILAAWDWSAADTGIYRGRPEAGCNLPILISTAKSAAVNKKPAFKFCSLNRVLENCFG